jgi:hypothetical protein
MQAGVHLPIKGTFASALGRKFPTISAPNHWHCVRDA